MLNSNSLIIIISVSLILSSTLQTDALTGSQIVFPSTDGNQLLLIGGLNGDGPSHHMSLYNIESILKSPKSIETLNFAFASGSNPFSNQLIICSPKTLKTLPQCLTTNSGNGSIINVLTTEIIVPHFENDTNSFLSKRNYSATFIDDQAYLFGGTTSTSFSTSNNNNNNNREELTNQVHQVNLLTGIVKTIMFSSKVRPDGRNYPCWTVESDKSIILFGGRGKSDLWRLDVTSSNWESLNIQTNQIKVPELYGTSCAVVDKSLYIFGGLNEANRPNRILYIINLQTGSLYHNDITKLTSVLPANTPRFVSIGVKDSKLYFSGASTDSNGNQFLVLDIPSDLNQDQHNIGADEKKTLSSAAIIALATIIPVLLIVALFFVRARMKRSNRNKKEKEKKNLKADKVEIKNVTTDAKRSEDSMYLDLCRGNDTQFTFNNNSFDQDEGIASAFPTLIMTTRPIAGSKLSNEISEQESIDEFASAIENQFYAVGRIRQQLMRSSPGQVFYNLFHKDADIKNAISADVFALNNVISNNLFDQVYSKWDKEFLEEAIVHLKKQGFLPTTPSSNISDAEVYQSLYDMLISMPHDSGDNFAYLNVIAKAKNQILMNFSQLSPSLVMDSKLVELNAMLIDTLKRLILASFKIKSVDPMSRFIIISAGEVYDQSKMKLTDQSSTPVTKYQPHNTANINKIHIFGTSSIGLMNRLGTIRVKCQVYLN